MYLWYHTYRPVGPEMQSGTGPHARAATSVPAVRGRDAGKKADRHHRRLLRRRGQALCPAATGFTHHISPWGDIEPCPIVQFAKESIHEDRHLRETFQHSSFLREFREMAASTTRGCIVLERPDLLKNLVEKHGAHDTTARKTALAELEAMDCRPSQFAPGVEIPEKSLVYRLIKRHFFNDFGAYHNFRPPTEHANGDRYGHPART